MTTTLEMTYTALITITTPDMAEPAALTVTLTPADSLPDGAGNAVPLPDCTLADLQRFADRTETAVAAEWATARLVDIDAGTDAHIKITILADAATPLPLDWRQHAVVLPAAGAEQAVRAVPVVDSGAPDDEPVVTPLEPFDPLAEAITTDAPAEAEEASAAAGATNVTVTVAESEPVFTEREAEEGLPRPPGSPGLRVAGRRLPPGTETWAAVDILVDEPAFRDCQRHALSSLDREVAGVLVGPPPEKQPDGRYVVHVTDAIVARHTRMHGASVTYTPESWRYVNDILLSRYPDESAVMVGWYHTHPAFGIFLSGMDLFIHQNFFTQVWHVALVLDPIARRSGFFCWDRGQSRVAPHTFYWPDWAPGSW